VKRNQYTADKPWYRFLFRGESGRRPIKKKEEVHGRVGPKKGKNLYQLLSEKN